MSRRCSGKGKIDELWKNGCAALESGPGFAVGRRERQRQALEKSMSDLRINQAVVEVAAKRGF